MALPNGLEEIVEQSSIWRLIINSNFAKCLVKNNEVLSPTLTNSWETETDARALKVEWKGELRHLHGVIKNGNNGEVCNLSGFEPDFDIYFIAVNADDNSICNLKIQSDGKLVFDNGNNSNVVINIVY